MTKIRKRCIEIYTLTRASLSNQQLFLDWNKFLNASIVEAIFETLLSSLNGRRVERQDGVLYKALNIKHSP